MKIPKDLLNTTWNQKDGEGPIKIICSRLTWVSESRICIINEENLDAIFDICSTDPRDEDLECRFLKLVSIVKIDNLHENRIKRDSPHLIC